MSDVFIEKNRQAILEELANDINALSDVMSTSLSQTYIELNEPIHPKLLDVYGSLYSLTGHIVALYSELMVIERGDIAEETNKPIGFQSMGGQ